jgi:hypothetical protein
MAMAVIPEELPRSLPDHTQLPESDGTFAQSEQEHPQRMLLTDAILPVVRQKHPDGRYCLGGDLGFYWRLPEPPEPPERGALAPDWYYVPDVPRTLGGQMRRSYVLWQGRYQDVELPWLRWWDLQGNLLPTSEERAEQQAKRIERLATQLRARGVEPEL